MAPVLMKHKAYDAALVAGLLPEIEVEIAAVKQGVETRAAQAFKDGKMDGSLAMALWAEYLAADTIGRKLRTRVRLSDDNP